MKFQLPSKISCSIGILTTVVLGFSLPRISQNFPTSQNLQNSSPDTPTSWNALMVSSWLSLNSAISTTTQTNTSLSTSSQNSPNISPNSPKSSNLLSAASYAVIDEFKKFQFNVNPGEILSQKKLPSNKIIVNQKDLLTVLINTREYFQKYSNSDPDILRTNLITASGVTTEKILQTLEFMITVLQEDIAKGRTTRLQDSEFINQNFQVIKWDAYNPKKSQQEKLRITKYAVFIHPGSRKKTAKFNTAIYSLKDNLATDKFYTRYTKQDVLSGIYEPGGKEFGKVEPLAYLTRDGLEEALMQGTILIKFNDGSEDYFNVDRNNEIPYDKKIRPHAQKRYWYFRKVDAIKGYGYNIDAKISIKPGVTFAGDILNIGLGRVVVIEYNQGKQKRLRMGVIADTGGAFLPNLYQLDFLAGIFPSQQAFKKHISRLPEYATAYILVKK
uniref:hypothetical protein n=2 Tax=Calothrix sp. 336/3 TaxID=1337936 RepID=UPI000A69AFCC|nr:hypothetical protein [Calothrix sp. 336/3]